MFDITNASREQRYVWELARNNPDKLFGTPVIAVAETNGQSITPGVKGTIIGIERTPVDVGDLIFTCEFVTGAVFNCRLLQLSFPGLKIPRTFNPNKKEEQTKIEQIVERYTHGKNIRILDAQGNAENVKKEMVSIVNSVKSYKEKLRKYTQQLKEYKKASKEGVVTYTKKQLTEELKQVKQLEKVEKVYLSTVNNIVIITKPLFATILINKKEKELLDTPIGAYTITIDLSHEALKIFNRTYQSDEDEAFEHPHVKRDSYDICFGSNKVTVYKLLRESQLFLLVDFLITFLSAWEQEGANPWISYADWLEEKFETNDEHRGEETVLLEI